MNITKKNPFDYIFVRIVRRGLIMLIPILTVGSIALILRSLPIEPYEAFISEFANGLFYKLFSLVYNATFGMLSVYMVIFLSYSTAEQWRVKIDDATIGAVSSGLATFLISVGFLTESFSLNSFSAVGMFTAILCGTAAPALYLYISGKRKNFKVFSDGSEPLYNRAVAAILPLAVTCGAFALLNFLISTFFNVDNFWHLISSSLNSLFEAIGLNFFGGLLYILLSSLLWFFGIHGSDMLESVSQHLLIPAMDTNVQLVAAGEAPTEIFTKTFFDVFVLMGGCGSALALLIALLLFSRRRSSRSLAKMATFPMLFNINEMMVFGLPIIYNPVMLIPFVAAPLASFLLSYAAMSLELVPLTTVSVAWTTPILLGGYQSTGSIAGAILQAVNLAVCVLIYMPFVKLYDKNREQESKNNINLLISRQKENDAQNKHGMLTDENGIVGSIAKQLVNDLRAAIDANELYMLYQPQVNADGNCIGAESLLRWEHRTFGLIYPPLIISLADEGGYLAELERYVFRRVCSDMENSGFERRVSINITVGSLHEKDFVSFLVSAFPEAKAGNAHICIEITEQKELVGDTDTVEKLSMLRNHGFSLAIDDFSMGFTSLKYLQESHFDEIKLDGSLVRGIADEHSNSRDIVSSIVYLSSSLGFSVLAEFVETKEQQELLEAIGCREYQGYLFCRPVPVDALIAFCAEEKQLVK